MIRDYWVYQQRQSETAQWALYVVKEFTRGHPEATVLDITVYSEDIGNATNSISFVGWHYDTIMGYVNALALEMEKFTNVDLQDVEQLEKALTDIFQH